MSDKAGQTMIFAAQDKDTGHYYSFCHPGAEHLDEWRKETEELGFSEVRVTIQEMVEYIRNTPIQ